MKNQKQRNLKAILVKERTWYLMLKIITIFVQLGKGFFIRESKRKKVPLDMNLVRVFMNVKIVLNVNISLDVLEPKEISNYMWLETL